MNVARAEFRLAVLPNCFARLPPCAVVHAGLVVVLFDIGRGCDGRRNRVTPSAVNISIVASGLTSAAHGWAGFPQPATSEAWRRSQSEIGQHAARGGQRNRLLIVEKPRGTRRSFPARAQPSSIRAVAGPAEVF